MFSNDVRLCLWLFLPAKNNVYDTFAAHSFFSFIGVSVPARQIRLSSDQIEAMFLKQNLALIAERMNVSIADAAIAEATVWDNPELSVGDINFWKRRGTDEYGGAVASPKQFSLELSQMVSLSARRIKLAEVEK